tara:strand:- start:11299 stop:12309 length:1011 start_codon:yes stop_codon:yes gene_type:complete
MSNLSSLGNLSNLLDDKPVANGEALLVEIELIEDFPFNRQDVSEEFKEELTEDIKARGVKEPLVISNHPSKKGFYVCKSGHTRKECAKRAGLKVVPVTIDDDYDDYDVIKANLKRERQSPQSVATFIKYRMDEGDKKSEIAKKLGKSPSYVSMHVALLNLPEPLKDVFDSGRCTDVTLLNELLKLYKKHEVDVLAWLSDESNDITRGSVKTLTEFIKYKNSKVSDESIDSIDNPIVEAEALSVENEGDLTAGEQEELSQTSEDVIKSESDDSKKKLTDPTVMNKYTIRVEFQGRDAMLLPKIRPTEVGNGYIKFDDDGEEIEAALKDIKIVAILES